MRSLAFVFSLLLALAACGGGGSGATPEPTLHAPEISGLKLTPDSALYMEGGGSVPVIAEFSFTDRGGDIETLHVTISDGARLEIPVSDSSGAVSGTITASFDMTTVDIAGCTVGIWLTDMAGYSSARLSAAFAVIEHVPEISSVSLTPASALHMEGGGSVVVTAEVGFEDIGGDLQTLWIRKPDAAPMEFDEGIAAESGTLAEDFTMSTETAGAFNVEFWLVDKTGERSDHRYAEFSVTGDAEASDWTRRVGGLPYVLNDVVWDGEVFIAVGQDGVVLTSPDGSDWTERTTPTEADLNAIAYDGSIAVAVGGDATVLLSADHGGSWIMKHGGEAFVVLEAVVVNGSTIVTGGFNGALAAELIMLSEDGGDSWTNAPWGAGSAYWFKDLIYGNGVYVAATLNLYTTNNCQGDSIGDAIVRVSTDGELWNEILLRDEPATFYAILHDGSRFITVGSDGTVFVSADAYNWSARQTPFPDIDYLSAAWNGSQLMAAGRISGCEWGDDRRPSSERPVGISSSDGGLTWEAFNIDGFYESRGMAWGNGRFVSVGQSTPVSGKGAIYTTD